MLGHIDEWEKTAERVVTYWLDRLSHVEDVERNSIEEAARRFANETPNRFG